MATMDQMYQGLIIEHDRSPRNWGHLTNPTNHAEGRNPLCGDEISLDMNVDADGKITQLGFEGRGCAVSKASASMMTSALKGKTTAEAQELFEEFHRLLTGEGANRERLGKLVAFEPLKQFPMRVKCCTMPWHAMRSALSADKS